MREIDRTIRWTSIRHVLKKGLKEKNISPIQNELAGLMAEEGLDFLTLVDRNGTVVFRFHNPSTSGDSLLDDPFIKLPWRKRRFQGRRSSQEMSC